MTARPIALTIGGLDPSGGAGLLQDVRTFDRLGTHGAAVATLWTVQSSRGVRTVTPRPVADVARELDELLDDLPVAAAKTGALGRAEIVELVADRFGGAGAPPLVVDPVLLPTEGAALADDACVAAIRARLVPIARVITPNRAELARLAGTTVDGDDDVERACRQLAGRGARAVLAKGGHAGGAEAIDVLWRGGAMVTWRSRRRTIDGRLHGVGCILSAAITAQLALGLGLEEAIGRAKDHLDERLTAARALGRGDLWIV